MKKPHAITPTDTRDVDTLALPAHLRPQASPATQAMFYQSCVRMGECIARQVRATDQVREAATKITTGA